MAFLTGTDTAIGDTTIIAAPTDATQHLVIHELDITNEAATANIVILKSGATAFWRKLLQTQGAALIHLPVVPPGSMWELAPGAALVLNLSAATQVSWSVNYSVR